MDVLFAVNLPSNWRRLGESPSRVRRHEEVQFRFPIEFPLTAPDLSLREDFNRGLPHIQPWLSDGRPVPCIYDGDLSELLHQQGFAAFLNQTCVWLERAALGSLIDPKQGWEPVRRDSLGDIVIADAGQLQRLVDSRGGHRFFDLKYWWTRSLNTMEFVYAKVSCHGTAINRDIISLFFEEESTQYDARHGRGKSVALVVWPGNYPSGKPIICDTYSPETVYDFGELEGRASLYGCKAGLNDGLRWLGKNLKRGTTKSLKMVVILLVRRPFKVIGTGSSIELCPYVIDVQDPLCLTHGVSTVVRPAAHRHAISRSLLTQMAGVSVAADQVRWTLLGAGSLGSKIAMHLARVGNGPAVVVDQAMMSPHNAARHALIPSPESAQLTWSYDKATLLATALRGLSQPPKPITADAVHMVTDGNHAHTAWRKDCWAVVNSTASTTVREAFGASKTVHARVIETSLYSGGRIGTITVEGPNRNPTTTDLTAAFYSILQEESELRSTVFDHDRSVSRRAIGHGCGSLTMPMSDGRLSQFAAGMSEYILAKQRDGLSGESGEVLIGRLSDDGMGVEWRHWKIPPVTVVHNVNGAPWNLHIHAQASAKMRRECARWPNSETGGVLMGRLSEVARVAQVVDVLEAPDDSRRSSNEFVLGTKGLQQRLKAYSEGVDWSLHCLGTWHSHLGDGGPSDIDRETARSVSLARLTPSMFLIVTPTGFRAFAAGH